MRDYCPVFFILKAATSPPHLNFSPVIVLIMMAVFLMEHAVSLSPMVLVSLILPNNN